MDEAFVETFPRKSWRWLTPGWFGNTMGSSFSEWDQSQKTSQPDEVREVGVTDGSGVGEEA